MATKTLAFHYGEDLDHEYQREIQNEFQKVEWKTLFKKKESCAQISVALSSWLRISKPNRMTSEGQELGTGSIIGACEGG